MLARPGLMAFITSYIICLVAIATTPPVEASTIEDTVTSAGEVVYLVNCTAPCTAKLYDSLDVYVTGANHTGYEWGAFEDIGAGVFNFTLWESATMVDETLVNTGTFQVNLTTDLIDRLGKEVVGVAILATVGVSAVLLGIDGGFLIIGLAFLICGDEGYAPGWVVYLFYLLAALLGGIGLYSLMGGLK